MLLDARDLEADHLIEADVCIVGAGAAGITIARALRGAPVSVCLLESGGFEFDRATQALYTGHGEGTILSARQPYLRRSRLRYFGGTTNHWTGWCRQLDEEDFVRHDWVPHSGWPITRADLEPFYPEAGRLAGIHPFDDQTRQPSEPGILPDSDVVLTTWYRFSRARFGRLFREDLVSADNVTLVLNANVTAIETDEAGTRVDHLRVMTLGKKPLRARARVFVLATGGVENARLLLVSDRVHRTGLGNGRDLVGRFFMEHLEGGVGYLLLTDPAASIAPYTWTLDGVAALRLSLAARRARGLLNAGVTMNFTEGPGWESEAGGDPLAIGDVINRIDHLGEPDPPASAPYGRCVIRAEQAPRAESRVTLDREVDALGVRRARLDWRLGTLDQDTIRGTMEAIGRELGRRGAGRALVEPSEQEPLRRIHEANHHAGTTRMSDSVETGIVDANCRMHDVTNLYVAGSSVFPTVGFSNPTLTILALALRLAAHVAREIETS